MATALLTGGSKTACWVAAGGDHHDAVRSETGWEVKLADHVVETAPPTESELEAIRRFDPEGFWTRTA
jgi:hypothetical protein